MKHVKTYEDLNKPQVGDYVIMNSNSGNIELVTFLNFNIGKITKLERNAVVVTYDNVPKNLKTAFEKSLFNYQREFFKHQIAEFSPNRQEIELKITSLKYNL